MSNPLDERMLKWESWRKKVNIDEVIAFELFEEPGWNWAIGTYNDKTTFVYHLKSWDWQKSVGNYLINKLEESGLKCGGVLYSDDLSYKDEMEFLTQALHEKDFVFSIPNAKNLDDFLVKMLAPGVDAPSKIFDFLRSTIIGRNTETCKKIQEKLESEIGQYNWFAPLSEEERTQTVFSSKKIFTTRIRPQTTNFVNQNSAKRLVKLIEAGNNYATTTNFQTGPYMFDHRYTNYEKSISSLTPPPGIRTEVSIMTPDIYDFLNAPSSPANYSHYKKRKNDERYRRFEKFGRTFFKNLSWNYIRLLYDFTFENDKRLIHVLNTYLRPINDLFKN